MSWLTKKLRPARASFEPPAAAVPGRLPNFFIAGAARSGTTSMWRYLQEHPDIFMPAEFSRKEPAFFCDFKQHFGIEDRAEYLALFANVGGKRIAGEASSAYLTSPETPGLIRREIPEARFIIILRNPADRAFSLYKWMRQYSFESVPTFPQALEEEKRRLGNAHFMRNNGQYYHNFLYFNSGLYHEQLPRFFDAFGRERIHVLIFEEFTASPLEAVRGACRFLGVDPAFTPKIEVHNPSSGEYGEMDRPLRAALLGKYADSIAQVGKLLGRDLTSLWV